MTIDLTKLVETLRSSGALNNYVGREEPIEQELAYDLGDIVESMQRVVITLWPQLIASSAPDIVADSLGEIRDELRHILYHVKNSAFFSLADEQSGV